jgi:hypothetical protein
VRVVEVGMEIMMSGGVVKDNDEDDEDGEWVRLGSRIGSVVVFSFLKCPADFILFLVSNSRYGSTTWTDLWICRIGRSTTC